MTTIVDNKSLVEFVTTGSSPIPPEVASDNEKTGVVSKQKLAPLAQQDPATDTVAGKVDAVDDGENPDGLTAEEKSTLTEKMKRAVAKRHSRMKEAEEFAADETLEKPQILTQINEKIFYYFCFFYCELCRSA